MASSFVTALIVLPPIDPVLLRLGPLSIRWYGLAYLAAFVLSYGLLRRFVRSGFLRIDNAALNDLIAWLALGVMVGGRLGWWLIYHREAAAEPWYEPFAVWHGGMSFHGGLVGVVVALLIWSRHQRVGFWAAADALSLVAPVGLVLGRIANFINGELFGRVTNVPWAVVFPGETVGRHPSQLYEAILEGPLLLLAVWMLAKFRPPSGVIAGIFLILYGAFRFAVEFTRQPDEQIGFIGYGWLTMGQLLSVLMAIVGATVWLFRRHGTTVSLGYGGSTAGVSFAPPVQSDIVAKP